MRSDGMISERNQCPFYLRLKITAFSIMLVEKESFLTLKKHFLNKKIFVCHPNEEILKSYIPRGEK